MTKSPKNLSIIGLMQMIDSSSSSSSSSTQLYVNTHKNSTTGTNSRGQFRRALHAFYFWT